MMKLIVDFLNSHPNDLQAILVGTVIALGLYVGYKQYRHYIP